MINTLYTNSWHASSSVNEATVEKPRKNNNETQFMAKETMSKQSHDRCVLISFSLLRMLPKIVNRKEVNKMNIHICYPINGKDFRS